MGYKMMNGRQNHQEEEEEEATSEVEHAVDDMQYGHDVANAEEHEEEDEVGGAQVVEIEQSTSSSTVAPWQAHFDTKFEQLYLSMDTKLAQLFTDLQDIRQTQAQIQSYQIILNKNIDRLHQDYQKIQSFSYPLHRTGDVLSDSAPPQEDSRASPQFDAHNVSPRIPRSTGSGPL